MEVYDESKSDYEPQIAAIQKRIAKLEKFKKKTYDSYMEELLSKKEYAAYISEYNGQIKELQLQQSAVQNKAELEKGLHNPYDAWAEAFKDYINVTELTRDMVLGLLDRVEVNSDGSITIFYKFQNPG